MKFAEISLKTFQTPFKIQDLPGFKGVSGKHLDFRGVHKHFWGYRGVAKALQGVQEGSGGFQRHIRGFYENNQQISDVLSGVAGVFRGVSENSLS